MGQEPRRKTVRGSVHPFPQLRLVGLKGKAITEYATSGGGGPIVHLKEGSQHRDDS